MAEKPKETENSTGLGFQDLDYPCGPPESEPWVRALKLISSSYQDEGSVVKHDSWDITGYFTKGEVKISFSISSFSFWIGSSEEERVSLEIPTEYRHVLTSLREDMARHRLCQILEEVGQG